MSEAGSSRRAVLLGGVLLAAPLAAGSAAAAAGSDGGAARLERLESEAAIRTLHAAWLRRINAGDQADATALCTDQGAPALYTGIKAITVASEADPHAVKIAANGSIALGHYACTIERVTALPLDCTLGQMAHAQGNGFVATREHGLLTVEYRRGPEGWSIARIDFAAA
jgi:hypothetical protein